MNLAHNLRGKLLPVNSTPRPPVLKPAELARVLRQLAAIARLA